MFQVKGGSPGDEIVALAALAGFIALAVRILLPWLSSYLRLPDVDVLVVAHVHWAIGSIFLLGAPFNSLSRQGEWWWVGVAAVLAGYALVMGNGRWGVRSEGLGVRGEGSGIRGQGSESIHNSQFTIHNSPTPHPSPLTPHS